MKISDLGEFSLIDRIRRKAFRSGDVLVGIGDDAAVLKVRGQSKRLLWTVDHVVEGIHFEKGEDWKRVGRKALARSLSDIAAMGGVPKHALVSLGLPRGMAVKKIDLFYEGFLKLAREFKVSLVGGDVTHSPKDFFSSVAVLGEVSRDRCILRKGARRRDALFVTGSLGGSLLGKHLRFRPRLREGAWLACEGIAAAMIDVSDGFLSDLGHILEESHVGASLDLRKIPISQAARIMAGRDGKTPLRHALEDGEDYELLFSSREKDFSWMKAFKKKFGIPVTCVGHVIHQPLKIFAHDEKNNTFEIKAKGFRHF